MYGMGLPAAAAMVHCQCARAVGTLDALKKLNEPRHSPKSNDDECEDAQPGAYHNIHPIVVHLLGHGAAFHHSKTAAHPRQVHWHLLHADADHATAKD